MKKIIYAFILLFIFAHCYSQNVMEAAGKLIDSLDRSKGYESVFKIIAPYNTAFTKNPIASLDASLLKSDFLRNALKKSLEEKDTFFSELKRTIGRQTLDKLFLKDSLKQYLTLNIDLTDSKTVSGVITEIDKKIKPDDTLKKEKLNLKSDYKEFLFYKDTANRKFPNFRRDSANLAAVLIVTNGQLNIDTIQLCHFIDSLEKLQFRRNRLKNLITTTATNKYGEEVDQIIKKQVIDDSDLKRHFYLENFINNNLSDKKNKPISELLTIVTAKYDALNPAKKSAISLDSIKKEIIRVGYEKIASNKIGAIELEKFSKKVLAAFGNVPPSFSTNFEIQNISVATKSSFSLPSESTAIDAIAIFMANRIKEETVLAFVDLINNNLGKLEPLPCLFKNTIREMSNYPTGQPARFGSIFKKSVATDLAEMPENIINCNSCNKDTILKIKKNKAFTDFFVDIADGVDLISNVTYYAETQKYIKGQTIDTGFSNAVTLFKVINRYYSNLQKDSVQVAWIDPSSFDEKYDSTFKLSLALMYEKEYKLFDSLLKYRYKCRNLDAFFNEPKTYNKFKEDFKELFSRLHRLDSYWQSHRTKGKAIVDMKVYQEKIEDVFKNIYKVLNYPDSRYPSYNQYYNTFLQAKEASKNADLDGIVFHSQKLLDLLSCYEVRLPYIHLPKINFNWSSYCKGEVKIDKRLFYQLAGDSAITQKDVSSIEEVLTDKTQLSGFMENLFCGFHTKGKLFHWRFNKVKRNFEKAYKCGDIEKAMNTKFCSFFVWRQADRKFIKSLKIFKRTHKKHSILKYKDLYACYLSTQADLQRKAVYSGARREVSQLFNFFTDVSKAKESKQLSKIISEYAEPPQSYKIKRFNNFSLDLNGYTGLFAAAETPQGKGNVPFSTEKITKIATGVTAPIGLTFSWAGRRHFTCESASNYKSFITRRGNIRSFRGGCFSATFVFIDIGAPLSYRIVNDTSAALPKEVTFAQVVAPGFLVGWGIPGLPLSLNFGIQATPQLRTFEVNVSQSKDAYRIGFSICYDIPFINLANTGKKLKRQKKA